MTAAMASPSRRKASSIAFVSLNGSVMVKAANSRGTPALSG
jgi:hypothetical protein